MKKKKIDESYKKQNNADSVIRRGYEIYDQWKSRGYSSRRIVSSIDRAVATSQEKKKISFFAEALSHIFALDLRVNEKYDTFLKCLFFYFSWRRETSALKRHKNTLRISESTDIREAIEIELQKMRERLEAQDSDDGDNNKRGGKRNGKAEEEPVAAEGKDKDQASAEKGDKIPEAKDEKESSDKEKDDDSEPSSTDEKIKEGGDKQQKDESSRDSSEKAVQDGLDPLKDAKAADVKEKDSEPIEDAEPTKNESKEDKVYNDAIDSPPIYEERGSGKSTDAALPFIDEVIIDNLLKGKDNLVNNGSADNLKAADRGKTNDIPIAGSTVTQKTEGGKMTDKNGHLYDKTLANANGRNSTAQNMQQKSEIKSQTVQKSENPTSIKQGKTDIKSQTVQKSENPASIKQEKDDIKAQIVQNPDLVKQENDGLRVQIKVDVTDNRMNDLSADLNNNISAESVEAFRDWQSDIMREQLDIASADYLREHLNIGSADLGSDVSGKIVGKVEPAPKIPTSGVPGKK